MHFFVIMARDHESSCTYLRVSCRFSQICPFFIVLDVNILILSSRSG
ncbi:hypothetical protein SAMN05216213_11091 [Ectopseudomonas guguanensis]|uniref:Uncharacterized protein n=1 Tax=Ectopseudomonas guguanensis TaxID=1198456 RepID=A0A1H0X7A9_9GAMM|nr:hypothetical protein SAMN05216213_11091 [Pseudomonas guguanensis]